jgi:hypothetical protein
MATTFSELKKLWENVSDWATGKGESVPAVQNLPDRSSANTTVVSATVRATVNAAEYTVTADPTKCSELLISNLDQYIGIEVTLDEALGLYDSPNMITLEPGQSIKVGYIPTTISYRAKAAAANIRFVFGRDLQVSPGLNKSVFSDMKTLRYNVRGVDPYSPAIYYAVSRQLYKSTDRGKTQTLLYDFTSVSSGVVRNIFVTKTGTLLVNVTNEVWRSTDGGVSFSKVLDIAGGWWRRHQGIVQDPRTGIIVFAENPDDAPADGYVKIWRSTDDGATWTAPATGQIACPSEIRHFHSVQIDPFQETLTLIATSGDASNQIKWLKSSDGAAAIWEDLAVPEEQVYRTCGVCFTPTHYIWGSDNPSDRRASGIYMASRDSLNNPVLLRATNGPIIGTRQLNGLLVFGASGEGDSAYSKRAELVVSEDWGATWKRALFWRKRDDTTHASIAGISPSSFDGDIYVEVEDCEGTGPAPYYRTLRVTP